MSERERARASERRSGGGGGILGSESGARPLCLQNTVARVRIHTAATPLLRNVPIYYVPIISLLNTILLIVMISSNAILTCTMSWIFPLYISYSRNEYSRVTRFIYSQWQKLFYIRHIYINIFDKYIYYLCIRTFEHVSCWP